MKISCVQMNMRLGAAEENFARAAVLVRETAARERSDVIVLPETWNTGFFPKELAGCADENGARTKAVFGALAKELGVNIVAGSVANRKADGCYNTAFVFSRAGECVAEYDKIHAFTPMGEQETFRQGKNTCTFLLDGVRCGILICYDLRFPELARTLALEGIDVLFAVSQWPAARREHLAILARARAIENQLFLALCNSCGEAGDVRFGGCSAIIDPWGAVLAQAGENEEVISAAADLSVLQGIRESINIFRDRRSETYRIN